MDKTVHVDLKTLPFIKKITEFDEGGKKGEIRFAFRNGSEVILDMKSISKENQYRGLVHGISQKAGDSYAGRSITNDVAGAFDKIADVITQLATPDWTGKTNGGNSDLMLAVSIVMKKSLEDVQNTWATLDDAQKRTWMKHSKVVAEIGEIRLKRHKAKPVDATESLAGF